MSKIKYYVRNDIPGRSPSHLVKKEGRRYYAAMYDFRRLNWIKEQGGSGNMIEMDDPIIAFLPYVNVVRPYDTYCKDVVALLLLEKALTTRLGKLIL